jgi:flagellar hook-associated protein 1 FlgK
VIGSILNIARNALTTHQAAIQTAAQNVSNAQTEGYSRRRVGIETAPGGGAGVSQVGAGVFVRDISRVRDLFLDSTYRREAGNAAEFGLRKELLGQVEEVFGELNESGFSHIMDAFWASWGDLATDPGNPSVRGLVKRNAVQVTFAMHNYRNRLDALADTAGQRVDRTVREVNTLTARLADINRQVSISESAGSGSPDLLDERDRVLDKLSRLVRIEVTERSDHTVAVHVGTATVVDGSDSRAVAIDPGTDRLRVGATELRGVGGTLGALLEVRDVEIPSVTAQLDEFAARLVDEVNAVHHAATGRYFFDPARTAAGTIEVSSDVADPATVGAVPGAPGDNRVALQVAAIRDRAVAFTGNPGKTFGGYYADMVADVGLRLNAADRSQQVYDTLSSQAEVRRSSTSGVSTDEELMQLLRHQQAYMASAKLVTVADDMLQTILRMV